MKNLLKLLLSAVFIFGAVPTLNAATTDEHLSKIKELGLDK